MAAEPLSRELVKKLMAVKGECRGENIKIDWDYILHKQGEDGLKMLENKMAEIGYSLKYKDIKPMGYYPIGMDAASILAIKEVFKFDEVEMEQMGASAVRFSLLAKVFFRYFISLKMIAEELPKMWPRHYTLGVLEMPEYSQEEKRAVLKLRDFHIHPVLCGVFKGYFGKSTEMLLNSKVTIQETKCSFRGDDYEEYLIKWN